MHAFIRKLILFAFLVAACQPIESTEVKPTNTLFATKTSKPTSTPSSTHSLAETPTSVTDEQFIDLPEWVRNPDNNVLLLPYLENLSERPTKFTLVNPKDGEQVTIDLNLKFYFHYWRDSSHVVFLQEGWCDEAGGPKYIAELDISKGVLWEGKVEEYPEPMKDCYYFLSNEKDNVQFNLDLPETTIGIVDPVTSQTLSLTNSNDGVNDIGYALSPNKNYISVVQVRGNYQPSELWRPEYGNKISVFSLPDRKLLLTYDENQDISSYVTFLDNENLVYIRGNTPCLIMLQSLEKKCIHAISDKFPDATVIIEGQLSISKKLSFLYFHEGHGGFCLYDLFSGNLDCPTDHFSSMDQQTVINYSLSPDEKYLLFEYDNKGCPLPWCDNFGGPKWAVTDIEGNQLFEIGLAEIDQFRPVEPNPWRPVDK